MLRIHASASAAQAKAYYTHSLEHEGYYVRDTGQEIIGDWHGQGAARLGLHGQVTQDAFFALADNRHPGTGAALTPRHDADRRPGFDCTFSAPKSVALAYAFASPQRREAILAAFRAAVRDTMGEMEQAAQARVRIGGADDDRVTGTLVWGEFVHLSARPVEGRADVDLHAHCYVMNGTYDAVEGRWKALQPHGFMRDAPYYEAAFHARLACAMRGLGFGVERQGKFWDVRGVPRTVIDKSSRRTREIEAKAAALGITDAHAKGALGAKTRANKAPNTDYDTLVSLTWEHLQPQEHQAVREVLARAEHAERPERLFGAPVTVAAAIDQALLACFERQSVVSETQFLEAALRYGTGYVTPEALRQAVARETRLIVGTVEGRRLLSTRAVLAEEQALLAFARDQRGRCLPFGLEQPLFTSPALNADQLAAARHVLASWDRVLLIQGGAGTGKTRSMQEIIPAIERQSGKRVFTFAPFVETTKTLQAEGFAEARTVEHLLRNEVLQQRLAGQVIWIDEAGLLGARDMHRLFAVAARVHARVVLVGDMRQHRSIQRGDALRLLVTQGGLQTARVNEIVRQQGVYKAVAARFAQGDTLGGFDQAAALGWVTEAPDAVRYTLIGEDYAWYTRAGKSVLVIAPTHAEGRLVTAAVRAALRQEGRIGPEDRDCPALRPLQWGEAQKRDAAQYRPGLVVQWEQHAPGFARGERLTVSRVADGQVWVRGRDARERALPLGQAARFNLYDAYTLPLAPGDRLRITHRGMTLDGHTLANGALYTVKGFTDMGDIVLDNGWQVGKDFAHLASGYYLTSYAGQGKTVDRVLIAQGAAAYAATDREQAYVSVTRGKEGMRIYTDDTAALRRCLTQSSHRGTATELLQGQVTASARPWETAAHTRQVRRLARHPLHDLPETPGYRVQETAHVQRSHYGMAR